MSNHLPTLPECQNCGAPTGSNYCPECGQDWWKTGVKYFLLTGVYNTVMFTLLIIVALSTAQLMELRETHPLLVQWILN